MYDDHSIDEETVCELDDAELAQVSGGAGPSSAPLGFSADPGGLPR